jgi:hypothetical protein
LLEGAREREREEGEPDGGRVAVNFVDGGEQTFERVRPRRLVLPPQKGLKKSLAISTHGYL